MDGLILHNLYENYVNGDKEEFNTKKTGGISKNQIIWMILGLFPAYLSWNCNANMDMGMRFIYAFFAWFFGIFYIIVWLTRGPCDTPPAPA